MMCQPHLLLDLGEVAGQVPILTKSVDHVDGVVLHHPALHAWHDERVPQRGCLKEEDTEADGGRETRIMMIVGSTAINTYAGSLL